MNSTKNISFCITGSFVLCSFCLRVGLVQCVRVTSSDRGLAPRKADLSQSNAGFDWGEFTSGLSDNKTDISCYYHLFVDLSLCKSVYDDE